MGLKKTRKKRDLLVERIEKRGGRGERGKGEGGEMVRTGEDNVRKR